MANEKAMTAESVNHVLYLARMRRLSGRLMIAKQSGGKILGRGNVSASRSACVCAMRVYGWSVGPSHTFKLAKRPVYVSTGRAWDDTPYSPV